MRTVVLVALVAACVPVSVGKSESGADSGVVASTPTGSTSAGTVDTEEWPTLVDSGTAASGHTGDTGTEADALVVAAAPPASVVPWEDGDPAEVFGGPQGGWHVEFEVVVERLDFQEVFVTPSAVNLVTGEVFPGMRVGIALIYDPETREGHVPILAILIPEHTPAEVACERLNAPLALSLEVMEIATGRVGTSMVEITPTFANVDGPVDCSAL
ncbi:MAG: hypothetical protein ACI8PZ_001031 [Myxococcota bacterium]|jgi:hypothetical protein